MTTVTRARGLTATGQDTVTAWSHGRLIITLVILRITWQSFVTVQRDPGSELANAEAPSSDDGPAHGGHGHGHDRPVAERDNASATSLTLYDVCELAEITFEEADAGCDVLEASDVLRRATVHLELVPQPVPIVRRTAAGTLDSGPLRAWLETVVAERFADDVATAAECLEASEEFLWRLLEDNCDRVLLQAADWLFVRAGEPHQLALLYPADDDAVEPTDRATA